VRAAVIALLLVCGASAAHADDDPLAEAMRLEGALDYDAALKIVERAIAQGGSDREKLVTLHQFAGRMAAGLDRVPVAEDHFARALALDPSLKFAEGTSPKITEPFDRARRRTAALRITADIKPDAITIVPEADPLGLIAGIAVKLAGSERELRDMQKRRIEIPTGARAVEVSALDAYGNRVWSQSIAAPETPAVVTPTTLRPLYARWPFWATGTVIALGAGGVFAWRFNVAQDEWDRHRDAEDATLSELEAIEARGKRWALAANISFAAAGATTLIAIIAAARGSTTTATVTAQSDSVGFAIAGRF
jgi:hypothetical protein